MSLSSVIVNTDKKKKKKKESHNEARSRKRWTKDEIKEIWRCYIMGDPARRWYRKRMHNIWHERNTTPQTEQRLPDQIWGIMKNSWLSVIEGEEIERQLGYPLMK